MRRKSRYIKIDKKRIKLRKYEGHYKTFVATITCIHRYDERFNPYKNKNESLKRLRIENVTHETQIKGEQVNDRVADHIWVDIDDWPQYVPMNLPVNIQFDAKVIAYTKFVKGRRLLSWGLAYMGNILFLDLGSDNIDLIIYLKRNKNDCFLGYENRRSVNKEKF